MLQQQMLQRAYSVLTVKSVDDDLRIIEGVASTPTPDRMGDVVDPKGVTFKTPLPLLWQHRSDQPIGHVLSANVTSEGIAIRAQIAKGVLPRIDEAWALIKSGLVRGLSIGFRATEDPEHIKGTFGFKFTKWEWLELSAVTIPANAEASINTIKSIDQHDLAASGTGRPAIARPSAGVSAHVVRASKGAHAMKKTLTDQIRDFENTRAAKDAERTELMTKAADAGETLDTEAAEKYDGLTAEIKQVDEHLVRLRDLEATQKAQAQPVNPGTPTQPNQRPSVISVKDNVPPGIGFARLAMAKAQAFREYRSVREIVEERWPSDDRLKAHVTKAAVPAGLTTNAVWAGNLVDQTNLANEFIEFLRPQTIIGRLSLRMVPFNVRVTGQTTGSVANWVGQGKPKPVTSFATNAQTLLFTKIAAIAVLADELVRFSSPNAEALVRDELARAVVERSDVDFVDPAHAAVANVQPASITNGVTALSSAGTSADNIRTDIQNLIEYFLLNNQNVSNIAIVMPNTLALAASVLVNSLGQPEFPSLGINGGSIMGLPVVTSQYAANQSGYGNLVIALDQSAIFLADDGQVSVDVSREASIQMSDAPTNDASTGTGQSLVSLWQTNSVGIRAERYINWVKMRTTAVAYIDDANWGSIGSPS
jgi:HK97 family phage major capsid protein/HK97 family phage prohead protease